MTTTESTFKRNRTMILFLVGLVVVFAALYLLRSAIFPFLAGLILVYLMLPVINWIERRLPYKGRWPRAKRVFVILVTFILILALFGLFVFYLITAVADSFSTLLSNAPGFISGGLGTLQEWFESFRENLSPEQKQQLDEHISDIGKALGSWLQNAFVSGLAFIPSTFSMVLGFVTLPIFLFYILKDSRQLAKGFYSLLPSSIVVHTRQIASIIDSVLGRYIRAQLSLGLVVGALVFLGLTILGIRLAPALAALAAVTELIPTIGPWIGGGVGVLVTLAVAPDKVIWVALVYVIIQMLENILLVPRIQGGYLRMNPAIVVVLLVLGSYLAGILGMIVFPPLAAVIVAIYKYVRENIEAQGTRQLPNAEPSPPS